MNPTPPSPRRWRSRRDDAFARILDDALGADVSRSSAAGGAATRDTAPSERRAPGPRDPLRIDVAPAVMRRLGFRPCSIAEKRRQRAGRALRRAAVLAVVAVGAVVGLTLHNASSTVARAPAVTIPVGIERGLIRQGERFESLLGEFSSLLGTFTGEESSSPASSIEVETREHDDRGDDPRLEDGRTDQTDPAATPTRRAMAPGRWT